jgi:hypothetical protein
MRIVDDCTGFRCGKCKANAVKEASGSARFFTKYGGLAGPVVLAVFLIVILCGCCLACAAASEARNTRRGGGRDAAPNEETPLVPQGLVPQNSGGVQMQRQGVAKPKPKAK